MSTAAFIALGLAGCHLSLGAHTHVDLAVEHGLSMLQRQVSPVSRLKPWQVNRYILANYHKAGVHLTAGIFFRVFSSLDTGKTLDLGNEVYPCSPLNFCFGLDAPVLQITDTYNRSVAEDHARRHGDRPILTAVSVRDPIRMAASAYCYHHEGQEATNELLPVKDLQRLGVLEGTALAAESMLPLIRQMVSVVDDAPTDLMVLSFERLTESSDSFDAVVNELLDFWFPKDLLTPSERQTALRAAQEADGFRHPGKIAAHTNDPQCEHEALKAMQKIDPKVLRTYKHLQQRLGYLDP